MMDRFVAMLLLLGLLVVLLLWLLALFSVAPVLTSCSVSLLYSLYLFIANEGAGVHHAQEFENRFWTVITMLFTTAVFFAKDSPLAFGLWSPSLGFLAVLASGYVMHAWDRHVHRMEIGRAHGLSTLRRTGTATRSLTNLSSLEEHKITAEQQLNQINSALGEIDQIFIPSTLNNWINRQYVIRKEQEIIAIFAEAEPKALNYLISHVQLGLLFYKVKDHRNFGGMNRTEIIELLAVNRLSALNILSRVLVLHALQMMKFSANPRAEFWVRNIIVNTHQDDLSDLKTLTDAKGNYFCMVKLLYDDIRSETVRHDIRAHIKKEAAVQQAHMSMGTRRGKLRAKRPWRKILSDVDDTLTSSAGHYPAGIDKRYSKKVVYPGVLAFYRELDLGSQGPEEWPPNVAGNLVFLSARPHVYKDVTEKQNFAKFEKLRTRGMHAMPSLLAGDLASGSAYMMQGNMEPLATKKFSNFKNYVSIYPEFKHVFIGDNGQGDVRAGELMYDAFPRHLEALYVHVVQPLDKTHGYAPGRWQQKGLRVCFFRTYPDAAIDAATRKPMPLIRMTGLRRVCLDAIKDFYIITPKQWKSLRQKQDRMEELNQGIWRANNVLTRHGLDEVELIPSERVWSNGEMVRTPYGIATILSFDPIFDLYEVEIDWRPLDVQVEEHKEREVKIKIDIEKTAPVNASSTSGSAAASGSAATARSRGGNKKGALGSATDGNKTVLETVVEAPEIDDDVGNNLHIEVSVNKERGGGGGEGEGGMTSSSPSLVPTVEMKTVQAPPRPVTPTVEGEVVHADKESMRGGKKLLGPPENSDDYSSSSTADTVPVSVVSFPKHVDVCKVDFSSAGSVDTNESLTVSADIREVTKIPSPAASTTAVAVTDSHPGFGNRKVSVQVEEQVFSSSLAGRAGDEFVSSSSEASASHHHHPRVTAKISGRCIKRYTPPQLPVLPRAGGGGGTIFSFWQQQEKEERRNKSRLNRGTNCQTPYGLATVLADNREDSVVLVDLNGWGKGYVQRKCLQVNDKGNLFDHFLRQLSLKDGDADKPQPEKGLHFPYAKGTAIRTPYGEGIVSQPLHLSEGKKGTAVSSPAKKCEESSDVPSDVNPPESPKHHGAVADSLLAQGGGLETIGISITSWVLADKSHPIVYCTVEEATKWKSNKQQPHGHVSKMFSAVVGTIVSLGRIKAPSTPKPEPKVEEAVKFDRYYKDGASVKTLFGDGVIQSFREIDGFYVVSLVGWDVVKGAHPTAYLRRDALSYRIAKGCHEGYPVMTHLGVSGILASVEPTTGIHLVTIPSAGMACYLQPECVTQPLKAAVGEAVLTAYGEGNVRKYRATDDVYEIELFGWGSGSILYACAENFDRVDDRQQDREGPFGMNWLLRFLFFSSQKSEGSQTRSHRSRSNSVSSRRSSSSSRA